MKKNILHLICLLSLYLMTNTYIAAQDTLKLSIIGDTVTRGETVCVKIRAQNFTELKHLQFSFYYASGDLAYQNSQKSTGVNGTLSVQAFQPGILSVNWSNTQKLTLANNSDVMEICFATVRAMVTPMTLSDYPTLIRATNANDQEVPVHFKDTHVSALPDEIIGLTVSDTVLAPGQSACVRVGVGSFDDALLSMQFSLQWDANLLRLDSVRNIALPGATPQNNFNLNIGNQGKLSFSWFNVTNIEVGIDLQNGDTFFEVCFTALNQEGSTNIDFGNSPTPVEIIDLEGDLLNLYSLPGTMTVDADPFMRPGDTNQDGVVNHFDLLNIGLGFGNQGPSRQNNTFIWNDLPVKDWTNMTPSSQTNFKHLDADGNGLIETHDMNAILENWGKTADTEEFQPNENLSPRSGMPLFVEAHEVKPGENAKFNIILGDNAKPDLNVYGIAFSIVYDANIIKPGSAKILFENSWLKDENSRLLTAQYDYANEGRIDVAISGTNFVNRNGYGAIAELELQIASQVQSSNLKFDIKNVLIINTTEIEQAVTTEETVSRIDLSTGTYNPELARRIQVFPNPASNQLFIRTDGLVIEQGKLFNASGRLLCFYNNVNELNVELLQNGIYSLQLITKEGTVHQQFVINR